MVTYTGTGGNDNINHNNATGNPADVYDMLAGNDTVRAGGANDTIYGGAGNDSLRGDAGDDIVYGEADNDTVRGDAGNDTLFGGAGVDSLRGGTNNDILVGGAGADTLDGESETDTASYVGSTVGVNVTINATAGNTGGDAAGDQLFNIENLTGSSQGDTLTGDAGNNVIDGDDGADIIDGAAGNDTIAGGAGADDIDGGAGNDSLVGGAGADIILGAVGYDTIDGGTEADSIDGGAGNDSLLGGAGADTILGGIGGDTIDGGSEADSIDGGLGNDTIDGGSGDDVIVAGPTVVGTGAPVALDFNWDLVGADGTDITGVGISQDTGGVNVNVVLTNPGANFQTFEVETDETIYVAGGEPFNPGSSGWLARSGAGAATVVDINFAGTPGAGMNDEVENVQFRISDLDEDTFRDRVVVRAWDALGNEITVVMTETSADLTTTSTVGGGSTVVVTNGVGGTTPDQVDGSVLVTIAGPVARIEISYDNLETTTQYIYVSDIHFDAIPTDADNDSVTGGDGNDTIFGNIGNDTLLGAADNDVLYGGAGNDTLNGEAGNDTLFGDAGTDTLSGAAGNDTFMILDNAEVSSAGNDIILGGGGAGEGGTGAGQDTVTDYDVIDLTAIGYDRITVNYTNLDPENLIGTITIYTDATKTVVVGVIEFSEIEDVIECFTPGTMIRTEAGDVAVELLQAGDMVMTRDNGLQPLRWTCARKLSLAELQANPDLQPVRIAKDALAGQGPARTMLVSPQHRVLIEGARAELLFGEAEVLVPAKHLVGQIDATRALPAEGVTYIHILFDSHEIVMSDGIWTESFQPAERTLSAMDAEVRAEVLALFPALETDADAYVGARLSLKAHEARVLLAK